MVMALTQEPETDCSTLKNDAAHGVVSYGTPLVEDQGTLTEFNPSVSGLDYIVASFGDSSFFAYNLSEKVWMALGLTPRCYGRDDQRIVYDDLSLPEFSVAEGEISTQYFYSPTRNVSWIMSNEYLRRYLWMRGTYGVRVFFYETYLADEPEIRALMSGKPYARLGEKDDWYTLVIREHNNTLLVQVWAAVPAIPPDRCPEPTADGLMWPSVSGHMNRDRANALTTMLPVYLDDRFLERYEQCSFYRTVPVKIDGHWLCSPAYYGRWRFTGCRRVGRNMLMLPMRDLYDAKPDTEILHAHTHVLDPATIAEFDQNEEHVVSKTDRLLEQLLQLGDNIAVLCAEFGESKPAEEISGFSRASLETNGWLAYPALHRLAQVAPLSMTEQAFLSRCKSIHELWQRIPNRILRTLIIHAGHSRSAIKNFGSLKLLQALSNIVERLNLEGDNLDAFGTAAAPGEHSAPNHAFTALFVNYELRKADAHDTGDVLKLLESLDFDSASLNHGYGRALDHVFNGVIGVFEHLNAELAKLLRS